jgi:hypothetical protein
MWRRTADALRDLSWIVVRGVHPRWWACPDPIGRDVLPELQDRATETGARDKSHARLATSASSEYDRRI